MNTFLKTENTKTDKPESRPKDRRVRGRMFFLAAAVTSSFILNACGDSSEQVDEKIPDNDKKSSDIETSDTEIDTGEVEYDYDSNLALIKDQKVRNTNHDNSPFINTTSEELPQQELLGPRSDYLGLPNGNPSQHFPIENGGQFRSLCEFSHFGYDDPIVHPDQPGAAHLHAFFGNTDVNAFTTQESLEDSGSSTCNGQELNRSGYWVPAMFDGTGNVRIPERVAVYYKGEGFANAGRNPTYGDGTPNKGAQAFESGMRIVSPSGVSISEMSESDGGAPTQTEFKCTDNFREDLVSGTNGEIPVCDGDKFDEYTTWPGVAYPEVRKVLEVEIIFPNCFPTDETVDITDHTLWETPGEGRDSWFVSNCSGHNGQTTNAPLDDFASYPNITFLVSYVVEPGEDTSSWFLASDIDPNTLNADVPSFVEGGPGSTSHGDFWPAWHKPTFDQALDNCINFAQEDGTPSGCGFGYLTDGGPDNENPLPGPALRFRPEFGKPGDSSTIKVSAQQVFNDLCKNSARDYVHPADAAYCRPSGGHSYKHN